MPLPRAYLAGAAWLLTVAAAFSLGRMGGGGGLISSSSQSEARGLGNGPGGVLSSTAGASGDSKGESDHLLAGWFGKRASTIEDVTGGRELSDHVKHLLAQDDEAMRMLGFLRLLEVLESGDDLKSVLEVIAQDRNGRFRMTEQSMLLQKWAKLDPESAAKYATSLRDYSRFNGMNAVLRTWVKSNPEQAIAWAVENGASNNPGEERRGPGEDGNWAVATLLGTLAKTNLDRAIQVASEQPYSRARGRMMDTLVNELVTQRGDEAARSAVLDLQDNTFRASLAGQLAERMAGKDPAGAAAWANSLPAGETRQRALAEAISEWAQSDPTAAGTYLKQFGDSPEVDSARQRYAERVLRNDPEGALAWAQAITDEQRRGNAMQELLGAWARRDPPTALAWAQANGMQIPAQQNRGFNGPPGGFGGFGGRGRR